MGPEIPDGRSRSTPATGRSRMRAGFGAAAALCTVGLISAGCSVGDERVLVWHDWPDPEADVLVELLDGYSELDSDLRLIIEYVPAEEIEARFTPMFHRCMAHCGVRTVQETRVYCTVSEDPAHIGGEGPAWQIHEETWLVEEHITVDTMCRETPQRESAVRLDAPAYWPEDDIWNPTPYEESGLTGFNCADLPYDPDAGRTSTFEYRIVVDYRIGCVE